MNNLEEKPPSPRTQSFPCYSDSFILCISHQFLQTNLQISSLIRYPSFLTSYRLFCPKVVNATPQGSASRVLLLFAENEQNQYPKASKLLFPYSPVPSEIRKTNSKGKDIRKIKHPNTSTFAHSAASVITQSELSNFNFFQTNTQTYMISNP